MAKKKLNTDKSCIGWAIKGPLGFYEGWWTTRLDAQKAHIRAYCVSVGIGLRDHYENWRYHYNKGDRAVKVVIREYK